MTERYIIVPAQAEGRLSTEAQNLMRLATEEAIDRGQNFIDTGSLLLGLMRLADEEPAKEILVGFGLNLDMVRQATLLTSGRNDGKPIGEITLSPRSRRIIALAADKVSLLHGTEITPLHILNELVSENEGVVATVLENLGVNIATLRIAISRERQESEGTNQEKTPSLVSVTSKLQSFLRNPQATQEEKDELLRKIDEVIPPPPTQP